MKIHGIPKPQTIISSKGNIDIYPYHYPSGQIIWIARTWPHRPTDVSGKFKLTHSAAAICSEAFQRICAENKQHAKYIMRHLQQSPLDWFRSMNQSLAYINQYMPFCPCLSVESLDPKTDIYTLKLIHNTNYPARIAYQYFTRDYMPSYTKHIMTRKGARQCQKGSKSIPPIIVEPFKIEAGASFFLIPNHSYAVPYLLSSAPTPPPFDVLIQSHPATGWDCHLSERVPNKNYGQTGSYYIRGSPIGSRFRTIITFQGLAPYMGATLTKAEYFAHYTSHAAYPNRTIYAHSVTNPNLELQATWNSRLTGVSWDTPGGDYEEKSIILHTDSNGDLPFNCISPIQRYLNGEPNYGILLITPTSDSQAYQFATSSYFIQSQRPTLHLTGYFPAPPSSPIYFHLPRILHHT